LQVGIVKESQMFKRQSARLKFSKSNDLQFVKKISLRTMWWGHIAKKQFNGQKILPFEKLGKKCPMSFQTFAKCPSHL
jgi:hypothetical protein